MTAEPRSLLRHVPVRMPIYEEIDNERDRQDAKWGGIPGHERRDDHTYAAVLGEEFGECCKAYPQFCRHPEKCEGRSSCPRERSCCD